MKTSGVGKGLALIFYLYGVSGTLPVTVGIIWSSLKAFSLQMFRSGQVLLTKKSALKLV